MFKLCDFWMYSINLGVLIHKGDISYYWSLIPVAPTRWMFYWTVDW